jgi:hypothetical protein
MDQIKALFQQYYGPDNPQRGWYIVLTACIVLFLNKGSRRFGGIMFIVVLVSMFMWDWLAEVYRQFT